MPVIKDELRGALCAYYFDMYMRSKPELLSSVENDLLKAVFRTTFGRMARFSRVSGIRSSNWWEGKGKQTIFVGGEWRDLPACRYNRHTARHFRTLEIAFTNDLERVLDKLPVANALRKEYANYSESDLSKYDKPAKKTLAETRKAAAASMKALRAQRRADAAAGKEPVVVVKRAKRAKKEVAAAMEEMSDNDSAFSTPPTSVMLGKRPPK